MENESKNDKSVEFLCATAFGRILLHIILFLQIPKLIGLFLRSPFSHFMISNFIKKNKIDMKDFENQRFISFNDFFTRKKVVKVDENPKHFISPCDCSLSVYDILEDSTFHIKGFDYSLQDFFETEESNELIKSFKNGKCLVFRLCTTDYHRYVYVDNGTKSENHKIKGSLYSVQSVACENFKVYTKNRRAWTLLYTENFGTVAQVEIGAFSVGGIINHHEKGTFKKGDEKGYFDLHGSTIVLLLQKDKVNLLPEFLDSQNTGKEFKLYAGEHIGNKAE